MGIFRKERIEESKVQATFIVDQLQTKIRVAMEGLENKYQNFQQKIDQLSLAIVESFSFPVVGMQLAPALARVNNGLDQLTPREMEQVALFFGDSSFNRVTKGGRSIQGGKDRRISREFSRRVWTVIFAIIFLFILVSCTNTVGTEQPVDPTPITEVVEIEPTEAAPELPEGPAFAPTAEAESPETEENPVTEEAPVAEESPEAVGTPIPDSVVIDWIAQYAPSTPTPETFAEVPVISFDNNTSFVMTGGKAYVVTRVPDSDPIVEEFAADSYEQTEDGSVNFFQGEGEARMKVAVLAKTTNGNVELTPTAVPAPTPTGETPTEETPPVNVDPSENIQLASLAAGETVTHIETVTREEIVYDANGNKTDETISFSYPIAYNSDGFMVARYTDEKGEPQWLDGPFMDSELMGPGSSSTEFMNVNEEVGLGTQYGKVETTILTDLQIGDLRVYALTRIWIKTDQGQIARWIIDSSVWQSPDGKYNWQRNSGVLKDIGGDPDSVGLTADLVPGEIERLLKSRLGLDYDPHYGIGDGVQLTFSMPNNPGMTNPDGGELSNAPYVFYNSDVHKQWGSQQDYWDGNYQDSYIEVTLPSGEKIEVVIPISSTWVKDF